VLAYALRRLLQFIPTILTVVFIIFVLLNVLPGNAALMAAGEQDLNIDAHYIEKMKEDWGLDKPVWLRFVIYVKDLAIGNLGKSFLRGEPVNRLILERLWPTLKLALTAMLIALALGVPLGFYSALRQGRWMDTLSMMGAVSGVSIPQFWLGLLLMYFMSVSLGWLPPQGYGGGALKNMIMPAFTLGVAYMALLARTTRAAVVEILNQDYVRTARAKGLPELVVNRRHVMRNALILVLTTAGLQFGALMAQTVIVEKLFSWPGLGSLLVDSIFQRDIPVTQGCILTIIVVFLVVNLVVDLLYGVIDPRIRATYK
jgi:ABC-type dipeptide/oligopeptide/nickel transport system permease component